MLSLYGVYPAGEPIGTNGSRIRGRECIFFVRVCAYLSVCVCVTSDVVGEHDTMAVGAVGGMGGQRTLIVPFYFLRYVCSRADTKCNISTTSVYMKGCRYALLVTRSNNNAALFCKKNAKRELKAFRSQWTLDSPDSCQGRTPHAREICTE